MMGLTRPIVRLGYCIELCMNSLPYEGMEKGKCLRFKLSVCYQHVHLDGSGKLIIAQGAWKRS